MSSAVYTTTSRLTEAMALTRYRPLTMDPARCRLRSDPAADCPASSSGAPLVTQHALDGVQNRILRRFRGGRRGCGAPDVLPNAVVLVPALQRIIELNRFPLGVTVVPEPADVRGEELSEAADVIAIEPAKVEGHQDRLDGDRGQWLRLPSVHVRRNLGGRIKLDDALVGHGDQRQIVGGRDALREELYRRAGDIEHRVDSTRLELGQRLVRVDVHHLARFDLRDLEQETGRQIGAAALAADGHALVRELVEIGDILPAEDVDLLVVEREHHLDLLGDPLEHRVGLDAGDEGQHVGLHDAELGTWTLIDGEDVLHRSLREHDNQVDPVRGDQLLQIQP